MNINCTNELLSASTTLSHSTPQRRLLFRVYEGIYLLLLISPYIMHRATGGFRSPQVDSFESAFRSCMKFHRAEYLTTRDLRDMWWGPKQLVDWLLASDVHIILSHVHQGVKSEPWNCSSILTELSRLEYHPEFPTAENLHCPIFTQDKYSYLSVLDDLVTKTIAVALDNYEEYFPICPDVRAKILEWQFSSGRIIEEVRTMNTVASGWIVKFPFKTNGFCMKKVKTEEKLVNTVLSSIDDPETGLIVPYALIQPRLLNTHEYKVVLLNGKANHFTVKGRSVAFASRCDLYIFAENALRTLKRRRPGTITDGLVRVDIMLSNQGRMVVNEFESLEAAYSKNWDTDIVVDAFLYSYWVAKLSSIEISCRNR